MKKQLALMVLTLAVTIPAHAISEGYKKQLQRSGCTQQTDGNGCDITKTRAQNAAAANSSAGKERAQIAAFLESEVLEAKRDDAYAALSANGWDNTKPLTWVKGRYTVFLDIGGNDQIIYAALK